MKKEYNQHVIDHLFLAPMEWFYYFLIYNETKKEAFSFHFHSLILILILNIDLSMIQHLDRMFRQSFNKALLLSKTFIKDVPFSI